MEEDRHRGHGADAEPTTGHQERTAGTVLPSSKKGKLRILDEFVDLVRMRAAPSRQREAGKGVQAHHVSPQNPWDSRDKVKLSVGFLLHLSPVTYGRLLQNVRTKEEPWEHPHPRANMLLLLQTPAQWDRTHRQGSLRRIW